MRYLAGGVALLLMAAGLSSAQSLGEIARQQRQKSAGAAAVPVFTNANLPKSGGISVFGPPASSAAPAQANAAAPTDAAALLARQADQEKIWRNRFAEARQQLQSDRAKLDVTQREQNLAQMQYYSDPNEALRQQYSQSDLQKRGVEIDLLQKQIAADEKKLSDLTDELRREGLPPGWARE